MHGLREHFQRIPAATQQRHHHSSHEAQAVGLAFRLDKGAEGGAQRRRRQRGADHHYRQRKWLAAPVEFHHVNAEKDQQQHLHQGGQHLAKNRAEQVCAFMGGCGQQAPKCALLPFESEHARDTDQWDEDPGDQLSGRGIGPRVIWDRVFGGAF